MANIQEHGKEHGDILEVHKECEGEEEGDEIGQDETENLEQAGMEASKGFKPGMIHTPQALDFWQGVLKAPKMLMDILEEGYRLPFAEVPEENYEEQNNKSARDNMTFVRDTAEEWQRQGVVQFVDQKPKVVAPLTVVTRKTAEGSTKMRLCWDGSRSVNLKLRKEKVNLAHLQTALEITEAGDYQMKYDLSNAYFHIAIYKEHQTYLGACYEREDGKKQYFQFQYLPFGLSTAVYIMTKIMKPVQAFLAEKGIRHSIFIDDGRVVARSKEQAQEDAKQVLEVLQKAGWQIAEHKSDRPDQVSQEKEYLGFIINSRDMTVGLTECKKGQLQQVAKDLSKAAGQ